MSAATNEENVDEIIEIVKAVKRHLQEENCVHGLRYIISEAYEAQRKGKGRGPQRPTASVLDEVNPVTS